MSEFHVRVVRLGPIERHPNADTLEITQVDGGYPVIFKEGQYKEGDLAVYVPIDSIVPDTPEWAFLGGHRRIKAKRLRGIFSMGMLTALPPCARPPHGSGPLMTGSCCPLEGWDVSLDMGITKWEPPVKGQPGYKFVSADNEPDHPGIPKYTDIEGLRKHRNVLQPGEPVVITEKIHGMNGRWMWDGERHYAGSHNHMKKQSSDDVWWRVMDESELGVKIQNYPGLTFYGEVYGNVQDLTYGMPSSIGIRIFDILDSSTLRYLDYPEMAQICDSLGIDRVPVLHIGPWDESLWSLAEGKTTLGEGHVREGFVVRPLVERFERSCGRVILKLIGEGYLLRKEK